MKLLRSCIQTKVFTQGSVVTIGNFDGVHCAHQALLTKLHLHAQQLQLPMVLILFEPQPYEYFNKNIAPARLTSLREKLIILQSYQVDYVLCLHFNSSLAYMSASVFAEKYIFGFLSAKYLLLGEDFRFGYERKGDIKLLTTMGDIYNCDVGVFTNYMIDNQRVSSTLIRKALASGDFTRVTVLLGRPYMLSGRVIKGAGLGKEWGIPTANIKINRESVPLRGVFCVKVQLSTGKILQGVANLGTRPTIDGQNLSLEVHLLDWDANLYGERLKIFFLSKLREERQFASIDALIHQIHQDIIMAKEHLLKVVI